MTNEERDLIAKFVARVGGAEAGGFGRSVPSTGSALPPLDPEADQFIAQQFQTHPEARYRITQMAVVQEAALNEAANRMQQLQAQVQQLQQQVQAQAEQPAQPQPSRGFLGGLFSGGASQTPQPPPPVWNQGQPQYQQAPPQYAPSPAAQPGMFQRSGSGFLGSALTTAAGVAGGMVAGNALMDLFSGGRHEGGGFLGGGGFGGGGFGGGVPEETTIINNYGDSNNDPGQALPDPGWDNNTQGQSDNNDAGWNDNSGGGGGWDDNSGGGWDDNSTP